MQMSLLQYSDTSMQRELQAGNTHKYIMYSEAYSIACATGEVMNNYSII